MKLTLHIQWQNDTSPYTTIKEQSIDVNLPNSDFYYAFEAWMNLSNLHYRMGSDCIDTTIDMVYDTVMDACEDVLGLTEQMYHDGIYEIDDPIAENKDYGYAYVTIYVPKKKYY